MQGARFERGAAIVEYALVVALIAAVGVGVLSAVGGGVDKEFLAVSDTLGGAGGTEGSTTTSTAPPATAPPTTSPPPTGPPGPGPCKGPPWTRPPSCRR